MTAALIGAGCGTVLGLDGYTTRGGPSDGGHLGTPEQTNTDDLADARAVDSANCDVDLTSTCYACAPSDTLQFFNACTTATCVPFDDLTRLTALLPDGAVPPLPPLDAGTD
jgi:hypothetical protein